MNMRHHFTGTEFLLHGFRHKGYWFHGRRREQETMLFFKEVVRPGDCVIEVGGHIGYITMYFANLVGTAGQVVVFEPGGNNLPYIRSNTAAISQVHLVEKAVSDQDGTAPFFEEELTGQNNSLYADYNVFSENCERAFVSADYQQREVTTIRLDSFLKSADHRPRLLKIDIEGAEVLALKGAKETLAEYKPVVMVEVTNQKEEVYSLFSSLGYLLYNDTGKLLATPSQLDFNVCALHPECHSEILEQLGWEILQVA